MTDVNIIVPYCSFINYAIKYDSEYIKELQILRNGLKMNRKKREIETTKSTMPNELMIHIIQYCSSDILINISKINNSWNIIIKSKIDHIWNSNCIKDFNTSFTAFRESNKDKPNSARELYIHLSTSFKKLKKEWFGSITKPNLVINML